MGNQNSVDSLNKDNKTNKNCIKNIFNKMDKKFSSNNVFSKRNSDFQTARMVFLIIFAICAVLVIHSVKYIDIKKIDRLDLTKDTYVSINGGEEKHGELRGLISSRNLHKDDEIVIRFIIPKTVTYTNPVITTYITNSITKFYCDGKKIYSVGEGEKFGEVIGNDYVKVPLGDDCAGKEVKMCIHVYDRKAINNVCYTSLQNSYDADVYSIRSQTVNIYISNFIYVFGIICILLNFKGFLNSYESKKIVYISLIAMTGGLWIISSTCITTYYNIPTKMKYYLEFESLYALVYFSLRLFYLRFKKIKERRILLGIQHICVTYIIAINLLRTLKVCYFVEYLNVLHIFLLISASIYYFFAIKYIKKYMDMFVIFTGILLTVGVFVILYYTRARSFISTSNVVAMMIFTMGIYMFFSLVNEIRISFVFRIEREELENKVYEDKLTGINNRRSCEKYMRLINENKYIIYSFDINGLKYQNDHFGHEKGDELITAVAQMLKDIFDDEKMEFIGRMGGDEFLAITKIDIEKIKEDNINMNEEIIDNMLKIKKIEQTIQQINISKQYDFEISIAMGYKVCDRVKKDTSWECYNIADNMMYENKRKMKEEKNLSKAFS